MKFHPIALSALVAAFAGMTALGCGALEASSFSTGTSTGGGTGGGLSTGGGGEGGASLAVLDAKQITVGASHSCALLQTGEVACWGDDSSGQLGDGHDGKGYQRAFPMVVPGVAGATAIRAGLDTTCAIAGGAVLCWGDGRYGQLGDGSSGDGYHRSTPLAVDGLTGVQDLSVNGQNACAVLGDGSVRCWGLNGAAQWLGFSSSDCGPYQVTDADGNPSLVTYPCQPSPAPVAGAAGIATVVAGGEHNCAILTKGLGISCWGSDNFGQLGDGYYGVDAHQAVPTVVSGLGGVKALALGASHTCAVVSSGAVKCWGDNSFGQIGIGSDALDSYKTAPTAAHGVDDAVAIDAASKTTCAALSTGEVRCWGDTSDLLAPAPDAGAAPALVATGIPGASGAVEVRVSGSHACLRRADGSVACWGNNDLGQLGNGSMGPSDFSMGSVGATASSTP